MRRIKLLLCAALAALTLGACNKELGPEYSAEATFGPVLWMPIQPTPQNEVIVKSTVTSEYGIQAIWIVYMINDDRSTAKEVGVYKGGGKGEVKTDYSGKIPAQVAGTKVSFQLIAQTPYSVLTLSEVYSYVVGAEPTPEPEPDSVN